MKHFTLLLLANLFICLPVFAQDDDAKTDQPDPIEVIRKHGLEQSQVMDIASWITDVYGPRLTGSPMLDKATDWAVKTLKSWGMKNVLHAMDCKWLIFAFYVNDTLQAQYSLPVIVYDCGDPGNEDGP